MTPNEAMGRFVTFDPISDSLVGVSDPYSQNNKNFQPRVGLLGTFSITERRSCVAGYGYQVDQPITGMVTGLNSNPPFAVPISVGTAQPLSALGTFYDPNNATNISPIVINPDFKNANVQSWNLNIQHQILSNTGIMIGYFGSKGTHLEADRNINQPAALGSFAPGSKPFIALPQPVHFCLGRRWRIASMSTIATPTPRTTLCG